MRSWLRPFDACAARHGQVLLHGDSHYAALPVSVQAIDIRTV